MGLGRKLLHGVKLTPHDIDIADVRITDETGAYADVRRIGDALAQIAVETQAVAWSESQHIRSHRGLYRLGKVELDVVGAGEMREEEDS